MASFRVRYLVAALGSFAFLLTLLVACSDSSSTSQQENSIELRALLPAPTRGFLTVEAQENAAMQPLALFDALAASPWRHTPADLLAFYASGLDMRSDTREFLFAQATQSGDEFVLLLDMNPQNISGAKENIETTTAAPYEGIAIERIAGNGLFLARFNELQWAIASRASLEAVIDVYRGAAAGIEASLLADYIPPTDDTAQVFFIYGLPALYRSTSSPGTGDASLNGATVVRGKFGQTVSADTLQIDIVTPNAEIFAERFNAVVPASVGQRLQAQASAISVEISGPHYFEQAQSLLKSLSPSMNALDYANAVNDPGNPPWLNFDVGENPNSIFINFEFSDAQSRASFTAEHLPEGFTLAPLRILADEEPRYFLVLNVYQSSGGLVEGARAEWSVFVQDPDTGAPRFLVIQAAAEAFSADSVNGFTQPEPVSHLLKTDAISSYVGVVDEDTELEQLYFSSSIVWPQTAQDLVRFSREFVVANDYIFWGNAVADRGLYNSSVHNRSAVRIANDDIQIDDRSRWAGFVQAAPVHTLVYRNRLDIVISPWWNLDADYLDVTPEYRQELLDFKNDFYPGTVIANAEAAMRGERPALTVFEVGEDVLSTFYHFEIVDVPSLFNSLNVAGVDDIGTPMAIALHEGEGPGYYLTLAVSQRAGDPCGVLTRWGTYVRNEQGNPQTLQIDTMSSDACIDPVSLIGLNAAIEHDASDEQLRTSIATPFIHLDMQTDLRQAAAVSPGADAVEAGDRLCALNGVCDALFYDGKTLSETLLRVDASAVAVNANVTPWSAAISAAPSQVTVRVGPALMAANRWINVPVFGVNSSP